VETIAFLKFAQEHGVISAILLASVAAVISMMVYVFRENTRREKEFVKIISEDIKANTAQIVSIQAAVNAHDQRTAEAIRKMEASVKVQRDKDREMLEALREIKSSLMLLNDRINRENHGAMK
jgi:uncharacterized membrane protein